jgi:hypothetical protein
MPLCTMSPTSAAAAPATPGSRRPPCQASHTAPCARAGCGDLRTAPPAPAAAGCGHPAAHALLTCCRHQRQQVSWQGCGLLPLPLRLPIVQMSRCARRGGSSKERSCATVAQWGAEGGSVSAHSPVSARYAWQQQTARTTWCLSKSVADPLTVTCSQVQGCVIVVSCRQRTSSLPPPPSLPAPWTSSKGLAKCTLGRKPLSVRERFTVKMITAGRSTSRVSTWGGGGKTIHSLPLTPLNHAVSAREHFTVAMALQGTSIPHK